jgi:hypothetical protein
MAKKEKAIYAPGELSRVRKKLGELDIDEAKRMARILGGEVGVERAEAKSPGKQPRVRHETVDVIVGGGSGGGSRHQLKHRIDMTSDTELINEGGGKKKRSSHIRGIDPADNPAIPIKMSYWERVKIDKYAGQVEFEIKNSSQVLYSIVSVFGSIPDQVSPAFVTKRMNDYYKRIELLVTSTRNLLPRNNLRRNERMKKVSVFAFSVLDVIRYWNIERIASDLARIQAHPRTAKVGDFSDILRAVYKPLYILERLDPEQHIKGSYKLLYKILYLENPTEAKEKYQELIRTALASYGIIRRDIRFLLYPLLLKLLSDRWLSYESFFMERRNRFLAFIQAGENDQIVPGAVIEEPVEKKDDESSPDNETSAESGETVPEEKPEEDISEEEKAKRAAVEAEKRAVERGLHTLESLFPKAGWDRISLYPDLYPYFADVFDLKKGYELIAPTDPLQQVVVLMRILEELFFGLRYVNFGVVPGADGESERVDDVLGSIISNWHQYIDTSFNKEYLPRLDEYCRILESAAETRTSSYARRILNELHWTKRLYFLPYYHFESLSAPPFQKKDIIALYPQIRHLRKYLTAVAAGIEQGNKQGGAEANAPCDGIDNPWDTYIFQVPNPLSIRLDALLGKKRNNASLLFFTLAVTVVLDHIVNNEDSWAYEDRNGPLFRSVDGEGVTPRFGVDTKIDADSIFKLSLKQRVHREGGTPDF